MRQRYLGLIYVDVEKEGEEEYQNMHSKWVMKGQEADQQKHK